ncbi:MAG: DUF559 domain-containing protein, partial [Candidatus Micrarchaeota archaeon]
MVAKNFLIICQTCGKKFYVIRSRALSKNVKYCSHACYAISLKGKIPCNTVITRVERKCATCGKSFYARQYKIREGKGKYCSKKCSVAAQRKHFRGVLDIKEITRLYLEEKMAIRRIAERYNCNEKRISELLHRSRCQLRSLSEVQKSKVHFVTKKKIRDDDIIRDYQSGLGSREIANKYACSPAMVLQRMKRLRIKRRDGKEAGKVFRASPRFKDWQRKQSEAKKITQGTPEAREFHRRKILKQYSSGTFPKQTNTAPERAVKQELVNRGYVEGVDFVHQFKFYDKFMCDFVFPQQKVVVECDGDFWHANPVRYARKPLKPAQKATLRLDKAKEAYVRTVDNGSWTLLRFWESDIKKDASRCVDKIELALKKR